VDPLLEERVTACHGLVVAPVVGRLELLHQRGEVAEDHLADGAFPQEPAQTDGQRLVVIVLADQYDAARARLRLGHRLVVGHRRERRLLHQHVLAGGKRLQRQLEMEARGHGDDHGVDAGVGHRQPVSRVALHPAETLPERFRADAVAARVAADHVGGEPAQVAAVNVGDEPAAQEGDV
jgi:hypothetical protein